MPLPQPIDNELVLFLDDDDGNEVLYRYQISVAEYGVYSSAGGHHVIIHVSSDTLIEPGDCEAWENAEPWLEIRLRFATSKEAEINPGKRFHTVAYDTETDLWLTNFYHYSHGGVEDVLVEVIEINNEGSLIEISGDSDVAGPLRVRARFKFNPDRRSS